MPDEPQSLMGAAAQHQRAMAERLHACIERERALRAILDELLPFLGQVLAYADRPLRDVRLEILQPLRVEMTREMGIDAFISTTTQRGDERLALLLEKLPDLVKELPRPYDPLETHQPLSHEAEAAVRLRLAVLATGWATEALWDTVRGYTGPLDGAVRNCADALQRGALTLDRAVADITNIERLLKR